MSLSLSIVIPTSDILLEKNYSFVSGNGNGSPLSCDNSYWSLAIYEVWDKDRVYRHLMDMIKSLISDTLIAQHNMDFGNTQKFFIQRCKISEGLRIYNILSEDSFKLIPALKILYDVNEKYDNMLKQVSLDKMYEVIYNKIVQLQVDIQTSEEKSSIQKNLFDQEKGLAEFMIRNFKEFGGSKDNYESLNRLIEGVDMELYHW